MFWMEKVRREEKRWVDFLEFSSIIYGKITILKSF